LIGRHPECDILIESRKISRRHCCIAQVGDYLVVRDLASTNGIRINGVRVLEGRLKANDELTIGGHSYRVSWDLIPGSSADAHAEKQVNGESPRRDGVHGKADDLISVDEPIPLAEPLSPPPRSRSSAAPEQLGRPKPSDLDVPNSHIK
jgi:pSer/pThr/pTyr-binding forkhead associated (FHA) protein